MRLEELLCRILGAEPYEEEREEERAMTLKEAIMTVFAGIGFISMVIAILIAENFMGAAAGLAGIALVLCAPFLIHVNKEPYHG